MDYDENVIAMVVNGTPSAGPCQHTTMAVVCSDCGNAWAKAASARPDEAAAVLTLMHIASQDTDAVSMFSFGESVQSAEASVVVLRGPALVARFRDWAESQDVFTRGKPVQAPAGWRAVDESLDFLVEEAAKNAFANGYDEAMAGTPRDVAIDIMDHAADVQAMVERGDIPPGDDGIDMVACAVLRARVRRAGWQSVVQQIEAAAATLNNKEAAHEETLQQLSAARGRIAEIESKLREALTYDREGML
jgi:hypothetical protein